MDFACGHRTRYADPPNRLSPVDRHFDRHSAPPKPGHFFLPNLSIPYSSRPLLNHSVSNRFRHSLKKLRLEDLRLVKSFCTSMHLQVYLRQYSTPLSAEDLPTPVQQSKRHLLVKGARRHPFRIFRQHSTHQQALPLDFLSRIPTSLLISPWNSYRNSSPVRSENRCSSLNGPNQDVLRSARI